MSRPDHFSKRHEITTWSRTLHHSLIAGIALATLMAFWHFALAKKLHIFTIRQTLLGHTMAVLSLYDREHKFEDYTFMRR